VFRFSLGSIATSAGRAIAFSALTLLVGRQEWHLAFKKEWWGAGVVVCLERRADLHMAQLMPLPLTISCFSKIQIGFTFLVPAHPGSPGKGPLNGCVCGNINEARWAAEGRAHAAFVFKSNSKLYRVRCCDF